jgi:phytoene dehydrogenase-like protein
VERSVRERVIIVGGGIAGLVCATELRERGREVLVLEASDAVGGRIRTDTVDGFRVDRGFQVLLTAYPTCREVLDIPSLNLGRFEPGAMVRVDGRFVRIGDPLRRPSALLRNGIRTGWQGGRQAEDADPSKTSLGWRDRRHLATTRGAGDRASSRDRFLVRA